LFNVVESSGNYVFEDNNPLRALRARIVSYALGAYKVFVESVVEENIKKGSFDWKLKGLVLFIIVESGWRATNPPLKSTISPKTPN
jgi:hypothetical protein